MPNTPGKPLCYIHVGQCLGKAELRPMQKERLLVLTRYEQALFLISLIGKAYPPKQASHEKGKMCSVATRSILSSTFSFRESIVSDRRNARLTYSTTKTMFHVCFPSRRFEPKPPETTTHALPLPHILLDVYEGADRQFLHRSHLCPMLTLARRGGSYHWVRVPRSGQKRSGTWHLAPA